MPKFTPLRPRNGHTLMILVVARISGCSNQKELSLKDQEDYAKQIVADEYQGPAEFRIIATKGKGEQKIRPELKQIEAILRTRTLDLLFCEDLGRVVRGTDAARIVGIAVDHGVRVIAQHDDVDTTSEHWETDVIDACKDHVGHNAHTSKRIKNRSMTRFLRNGESTPLPIYGYTIPDGVKSYAGWLRDPAAEPIYREWLGPVDDLSGCCE